SRSPARRPGSLPTSQRRPDSKPPPSAHREACVPGVNVVCLGSSVAAQRAREPPDADTRIGRFARQTDRSQRPPLHSPHHAKSPSTTTHWELASLDSRHTCCARPLPFQSFPLLVLRPCLE